MRSIERNAQHMGSTQEVFVIAVAVIIPIFRFWPFSTVIVDIVICEDTTRALARVDIEYPSVCKTQ